MKTDSQFKFEKQALDVALASGSAQVTFPTPGKAVQFRQRCYAFRKWKRETMGDQSPYEALTIKAPQGSSIEIVGRKFEGQIVAGPGLVEPVLEVEDEDGLLADILAVKQKVLDV